MWRRIATTLVVVALILTAQNVWRVVSERRTARPPLSISRSDAEMLARRGGSVLGADGAALSIVVFSDYQCEGCAQLHFQLERLLERYPAELSVTVRHYPLSAHPFALSAARWASCAANTGQFAALNSGIFERQKDIPTLDWMALAVIAGITDTSALKVCRESDHSLDVIQDDIVAGRALGIMMTPTILVDSLLYGGAPANLEGLVAAAIKRSPRGG